MISARWTDEFRRQIRRGRHVLLYGNVQDHVLLNGSHCALRSCLENLLSEERYALRGHYDIVDGVTFESSEMIEHFRSLVEGRSSEPSQRATSQEESVYRIPGEPASMAPARNPTPTGGLLYRQPEVALAAIRTALRDSRTPVSFVIDFSDKLTSSLEHHEPGERIGLVTIRKMTAEARRHRRGEFDGVRNLVVLVAPVLGQVPAWLYRENPFLCTIEVEKPQPEERRFYLSCQYSEFYAAEGAKPSDQMLTEFSELTDGLSNWDLESLRLTSRHEKQGLSKIRQLVDFFKHGKREDHWENLNRGRLSEAREVLRTRVIGQDAAVDAVIRQLVSAKVGVGISNSAGRSTRPKGVFFFVGPTGVGKTELAKAMAELIFSDDTAFARFDMSEYSQEHTAERLTGAPPSYVGFEAGGQLTNYVRRKPFTLILFDEIEKAHHRVLDKFLQVLDDGRLTDGQGETAYFDQSIIVFTSNIGSTRRVDSSGRTEEVAVSADMSYEEVALHYRKAVEDHFTHEIKRPELRNRLGENIIAFDVLRKENIGGILRKFKDQIAGSAKSKHCVEIHFTPTVDQFLEAECAKPENARNGGRGIRNILESLVLPVINQVLFDAGETLPRKLSVDIDEVTGSIVVRH